MCTSREMGVSTVYLITHAANDTQVSLTVPNSVGLPTNTIRTHSLHVTLGSLSFEMSRMYDSDDHPKSI